MWSQPNITDTYNIPTYVGKIYKDTPPTYEQRTIIQPQIIRYVIISLDVIITVFLISIWAPYELYTSIKKRLLC